MLSPARRGSTADLAADAVLLAVELAMLGPGEVTAMMRRIEPLLSPQATVLGAQVASLAAGNLAFTPLHGNAVVLTHETVVDLFPPWMVGLPPPVVRGAPGPLDSPAKAPTR